jgi:hypothetical protein
MQFTSAQPISHKPISWEVNFNFTSIQTVTAHKGKFMTGEVKLALSSVNYASRLKMMLVSCVAYSSTLKMKVTCSSKTSADFQQATRNYIPKTELFTLDIVLVGLRTTMMTKVYTRNSLRMHLHKVVIKSNNYEPTNSDNICAYFPLVHILSL